MPAESSRAKQFFDSIVLAPNPVAVIESFVADKKQENEFLEFKGGRMNLSDVKKHWSEALSGFANTEGGVLIWGIRASRVQSELDPNVRIDVANDFDIVARPEGLAQQLKDVLLSSIEPILQGVEIRDFRRSGTDSGFVVCYVPQGGHGPYVGSLAERPYSLRVSSDFKGIPHSILRAMFHPQAKPGFKLTLQLVVTPKSNYECEIAVYGRVENIGNATGRDVLLHVGCDNLPLSAFNPIPNFRRIDVSSGSRFIAFLSSTSIHVSQETNAFAATQQVRGSHVRSSSGDFVRPPFTSLEIMVKILSDNAMPLETVIKFDELDIDFAARGQAIDKSAVATESTG